MGRFRVGHKPDLDRPVDSSTIGCKTIFTLCETLFLGQIENIFIFNQAKHKKMGKKIPSKHFMLKEVLFEFYFILFFLIKIVLSTIPFLNPQSPTILYVYNSP